MTNELRIGIVGTGVMGADHAKNLAHGIGGARLTALADAATDRAEALAGELKVDTVYASGEELIGSNQVDAVIIASPDPTHATLATACIAANKPVLCEKPLAPTPQEAARVVQAERDSGKQLLTVGFMRRFDPGFQALKDALTGGQLGSALMTHSVHRNVEAYPGGSSADTITNSAIHEIDTLPWLAGAPIEKVQWTSGRGSSLITERQDPQFLLLWDANGLLHTVELMVHAQYGYDVRCEVVCERGTAELPPVPTLVEQSPILTNQDLSHAAAYPVDWRPRFAAAYRAELSAWVTSCETRTIAEEAASGIDALRATLTAGALVESMQSNGTVVNVADVADFLN